LEVQARARNATHAASTDISVLGSSEFAEVRDFAPIVDNHLTQNLFGSLIYKLKPTYSDPSSFLKFEAKWELCADVMLSPAISV